MGAKRSLSDLRVYLGLPGPDGEKEYLPKYRMHKNEVKLSRANMEAEITGYYDQEKFKGIWEEREIIRDQILARLNDCLVTDRLPKYLSNPEISSYRKYSFLQKLINRSAEISLQQIFLHELRHFIQDRGNGRRRFGLLEETIEHFIINLPLIDAPWQYPAQLAHYSLPASIEPILGQIIIPLIVIYLKNTQYLNSPWEIDARAFAEIEGRDHENKETLNLYQNSHLNPTYF